MALLRWIYLRRLTPIEDLIAGGGATADRPAGAAPRSQPSSSPSASPRAAAPPQTPRAQPAARPSAPSSAPPSPGAPARSAGSVKDALLAEIRKNKVVFYNMVVAQAQKIEADGDRVTFTFAPGQRALRDQVEQQRAWLESIGQQATGRRVSIASAIGEQAAAAPAERAASDKKSALRDKALADAGVQAMLEVFPGEIRDVEEIEKG
jgi:hypothetical protein